MDLVRMFRNFDGTNPHEVAAINALQDALPPELLERDADWVIMYKEAQNLDVSAEDKATRQALSKRKRQKRLE